MRPRFPARLAALACAAAWAAACQRGPPAPARLDPRNDACAQCRMMVSDPPFAAQLVAPNEEPRFFDDLGCLRDYLREHPRLPPGAVAYVADHRTSAWVRAGAATYSRVPGLRTPMGSGLVAHADAASRDADPAVAGAAPVPAAELLGAAPAAGGR
ncbi:nitrous oxide reductase accessory protein NosL [Anaeromyxobacter sp. Red801]|uniref:nitrous oxide reductase accessory protein NosL n=1 Tax=Anaeromyxobacter sp. Red801 TaxID=3411632 RepID=UPI003BA3ADC0